MAQAVVHVGYPRTGSTWLQQVVFPRMDGVKSAWDSGIWRDLSWKLGTAEDADYYGETLRVFTDEFADRSPHDALVYSQELFCGRYLDPATTMPRSFERLKQLFPEARILVVPRRQDDIVRALYGLYVRTGGYVPLGDFLAAESVEGMSWDRTFLEYDRMVDRYTEAYGSGNVMVLPYELSRRDPDTFLSELGAFCGATGYDDYDTIARREVNRSFTPPAAFVLRIWNRLLVRSQFNARPLLGARSSGLRVHQLLAERLDPGLRQYDWPWPSRRDRRTLAELAESYAASNDRLQLRCAHSLADLGYPMPGLGVEEAVEPLLVREPAQV